MIVPRTRLLLWTALIVLPFTALAASWPPAVAPALFFIGALFALALFDAFSARTRSSGARIELSPLVRLQKDRPGNLELTFHNTAGTARELKVGLALPSSIETPEDVRAILLPAGAELSRSNWPCLARERGRFVIDRAFLENSSPLGFWGWRAAQPVHGELRVYPDLLAERRQVAAVFLRRQLAGQHVQRSAGQGREFEKLRDYLPGDSLADVHWKASAKRRQLATKVHQVERAHEVYIIVDASRLSARAAAGPDAETTPPPWRRENLSTTPAAVSGATALERFVTAALILGFAAEQQGDQFGLITFSNRVLSFVRARGGAAHFGACRDQLYTLQPQAVTPDFQELCSFIKLRLRKRALLIFLTSLDDPFLAESFVSSSQLLARQHLLLVNTLRPAGAHPLFSDSSVAALDDLYTRLGGHLQWQRLRELEKVLRRRGIRFAALDPAILAAELVRQHAEVRAHEWV